MSTGRFLLAFAVLLACAVPLSGHDSQVAGSFGFQSSVAGQIEDAGKKLVQLGEAMPEETFSWRPAEGVRSFAEVLLHVSAANYFFGSMLGTPIPEGIDARGLEKGSKEKATVIATLKSSLEFARGVVKGVPDDQLGSPMKIFGRDGNKGSMLMLYATHAHEHLGQAIAYARSNKVAPPWSRGSE